MNASEFATKYQVTDAQIDKAHRVEDLNKHIVFYQVESQTTDGIEYKVVYDQVHHVLTCTCPAGNPPIVNGFPAYAPRNCWHMRAACAHAAEIKAERIAIQEINMIELAEEIAAEAQAHGQYTVVTDPTSSSLDGVKFEVAPSGKLTPMR